MNTAKQLGIINGFLGNDLLMSLIISNEGDVFVLQMYGRRVRVFAEPVHWNNQEVEGASKEQVLVFLQFLQCLMNQ
jgi:hypothetical protein